MTRFEVSSSKFEGVILLEYDDQQFIYEYRNNATMSLEQKVYFGTHFPSSINLLWELRNKAKLTVVEVSKVLAFDDYLSAYKHDTGDINIAKVVWDELSETDKRNALNYIPIYHLHLQKTGITKLKVENYLIRRTWDKSNK